MNNLMSNFSGLALSRMEMKKVKGGQCYYGGGGSSPSTCSGETDCRNAIRDGWGTNYCCSTCSTASWCKNGACPQ